MMRCQQFVERLMRGPTGAYRRAFLSLLLSAGAIFALMTFTACDCDENGVDDCDEFANKLRNAQIASMNNRLNQEQPPNVKAKINGTHDVSVTLSSGGAALTGVRYYSALGVNVNDAGSGMITYTWRPPDGANDFVFTGRQPEPGWDPARPVFTFRNVPPSTTPSEMIPVNFALPATSPYGGNQVVESLTAQPEVGPATTAYFLPTLTDAAARVEDATVQTAAGTPLNAPSANVDMWTLQRWYKRDIPITSAQCQQAVNFLQGEAAFIALQIPEPPHNGSESMLLPLYKNAKIKLQGGDGLSVQGEGTFRPERFTFAANELPQTPGKVWVTFGAVTTPTLTCPAGKATDAWEIYLDFQLDLSYAPDNCKGCALGVFLCYEGQELPGSRLAKYVARQQANQALEKLVRATDAQASVQDYQDWGVTCGGPLPLQLIDDPSWQQWMLVGASAQAVTVTAPFTLSHTLEGGNFNPPAQIDLAFSSNLNAGWHWSDGAQTIHPPISYEGAPKTFYLVGQAPADTPAGMYSTQITATLNGQPTDFRVATDLIWVGKWLPPPQQDQGRKLYLPLVMK